MAWDQFQAEDAHPHVDTNTCGKCRRPLGPGHRVCIANIVAMVGPNPDNLRETGVHLYPEYELVHIDCHDPLLKKGL